MVNFVSYHTFRLLFVSDHLHYFDFEKFHSFSKPYTFLVELVHFVSNHIGPNILLNFGNRHLFSTLKIARSILKSFILFHNKHFSTFICF